MFLQVKRSTVVLIHDGYSVNNGSPYLDEHGEQDPGKQKNPKHRAWCLHLTAVAAIAWEACVDSMLWHRPHTRSAALSQRRPMETDLRHGLAARNLGGSLSEAANARYDAAENAERALRDDFYSEGTNVFVVKPKTLLIRAGSCRCGPSL